jgi:hypothetical protein
MLSQASQQPVFWVEIDLNDTWKKKIEKAVVEKGQFLAGVHFLEHMLIPYLVRPVSQFDDSRAKIVRIPWSIHFSRYQIFRSSPQLDASEKYP